MKRLHIFFVYFFVRDAKITHTFKEALHFLAFLKKMHLLCGMQEQSQKAEPSPRKAISCPSSACSFAQTEHSKKDPTSPQVMQSNFSIKTK
jgi:hypothetical protein